MKKIILGMSNLLLIVVTFTYMVINTEYVYRSHDTLSGLTSKTGFPVIGILFLIPAFIFTIIYLCTKSKYNELFKSLFTLFGGLFCLLAGIVALGMYECNFYIPYIVTGSSIISCVLSIISLVVLIKNDELKSSNLPSHTEEKEEIQ